MIAGAGPHAGRGRRSRCAQRRTRSQRASTSQVVYSTIGKVVRADEGDGPRALVAWDHVQRVLTVDGDLVIMGASRSTF